MADNWSDEELEIALIAYLEMLRVEDIKQFNRTAFYESLAEHYSSGRKGSAYRKRMENYSSLMNDLKRPLVPGIGIQENIGTPVRDRLKSILKKIDASYEIFEMLEIFEKIKSVRTLLQSCKK